MPQRSVISLTVIFPNGFSSKTAINASWMAFFVILTLATVAASCSGHYPQAVEFLSMFANLSMAIDAGYPLYYGYLNTENGLLKQAKHETCSFLMEGVVNDARFDSLQPMRRVRLALW